ncbi:MAG: AraC family transcriptional regulator [Myxococcaceae bacterium]|nr:MAG: AraC family transcriptional regulator [Myxococcaceae bacterium]
MHLPSPRSGIPAGAGLPLWPPLLATRGPGARTDLHAHHAIHLVAAVGGEVRVRSGRRAAWRSAPAVVTAPDTLHSIDAEGTEVLIVFLEPESDAGVALRPLLSQETVFLEPAARDSLLKVEPAQLLSSDSVQWTDRLVVALGGRSRPPHRVHPKIRKLLRLLRDPDAPRSLEALAGLVGLSPGRLMHVFTESVGIPLRPYLAWLRFQRAAAAIVSGTPIGDAAHLAGFADSSHLSRGFRRMFGTPPSALRLRSAQPAGSSGLSTPSVEHGGNETLLS